MFNKDISNKLMELYGEENVILFSKMEALKNTLILEDLADKSYNEIDEHSFERDWWYDNAKRLEETRFAKRKNITL